MTFVSASLVLNQAFSRLSGAGFVPQVRRFFGQGIALCVLVLGLQVGLGISGNPGSQAYAQMTFGGTIGAIDVEGNQRFSDRTIIVQSGLQVGDPFDAFLLNDALKALFATGNFSDVDFSRRGDTLVITVQETLFVNRIIFSGNDAYDDEALAGFISLKPTDPFSNAQLQRDVNTILSAYAERGFYNAVVDPKIRDLGDGRVDIRFAIREGQLSRVGSVNFVGNRAFSDGRLRRVVGTKQQTVIRTITSGDAFGGSKLARDSAILEQFYLERGFADFRLISAQGALANDRSGFVVTFVIEEGPRYRIGEMRVESEIAGLTPADLRRALRLRRGRTYKASDVATNEELIRSRADSLGFGAAVVTSELETKPDEGIVDIVFKATEGPKVTVERIEIIGNSRTRDEVIRREMRLSEGDGFSANSLRRSLQRIRNLGFFGTADIRTTQGSSEDKTVVIVEVEEASTGSLNLGGGLSSSGATTLSFSYSERNFLGRGQTVGLNIAVGESSQSLDATFREPWFLGRELSAGVRGFYSRSGGENTSFDREELGVSVDLGYKLSERLSQGWSYTIKQTDVSNVATTDPILVDQIGSSLRSIVGHTLSYNDLDSRSAPSDGVLAIMRNNIAGGPFGGDVDYFSTTLQGSYYRPLGDTFVLRLRGQAGYIESLDDDLVPLVDRFQVGQSLVRGFRPGGIGPRIQNSLSGIGANTYYGLSAEVSFPIPGLADFGIRGRVFTDAGTAYDEGETYTLNFDTGPTVISDSKAIRSSAGIGFTWVSPFGPLNFDWSEPIETQDFDRVQQFQFGVGLTL